MKESELKRVFILIVNNESLSSNDIKYVQELKRLGFIDFQNIQKYETDADLINLKIIKGFDN